MAKKENLEKLVEKTREKISKAEESLQIDKTALDVFEEKLSSLD